MKTNPLLWIRNALHRPRLASRGCLAGLFLLLSVITSPAAFQYFNGTNAVLNWDNGSTPDWGTVSGGPYNTTWANSNDAVFQGTAATVTNLGVSANSLTFSTANYILTNGTLTLTAAAPRITNTVAATIGSTIAGAAGFTKIGAASLTLSAANTFTGPLTNNAGNANVAGVVVANNNALSTTTVVVGGNNSGGGNMLGLAAGITTPATDTIYLQCGASQRAGMQNQSGSATWSGNVVMLNPGPTDTTAPNVYANGTSMTILGNVTGNNVGGGGLFRGSGAGNLYGNIWLTNSPFYVADSATWTIYSNSNLWSYAQINGGKLKLGTNDALCTTGSLALGQGNANTFSFDLNGFSQTVVIVTNNIGSVVNLFTNSSANPSVFTVNAMTANSRIAPSGAGNIIVSGLISLVKNGPFQLALGAANTYTGTNTINGGTLLITNTGTLGNPANPLIVNAGTLNLGGSSQTVGNVTMASGMITNGTLTASSYTVQSGTIAAVIGGTSATLTKTGNGTLILTNVNTFGGATTVTGGNVIGVTGGSCSSSAFTFSPGAGAATTNSVFINSAGGQWTCGGLAETAGSGSIYAEFNYGTISSPSTATAPVLVNGACSVSGTLNVIVTGGIGWASGLTYPLLQIVGSAPSSLTLNLVATPNGVIGGTLSYDPVAQIISYTAGSAPRSLTWNTGSGAWDINTSTNWLDANLNITKFQQLDLPTFSDAPGAGNSFVTNNSTVTPSSLTVSNSVANYTFTGSGSIGGNGALTKTGAGSLTIASANSYSGGTLVSNGTLVLANSGALGSGTLDFEGGSLDSGLANLFNANNNAITLDSDLIFLGSQNLNLGSSVISFAANRTFAVSNSTLTVSGSLSAPGLTLTKSGSGTLQQGANNSLGGISLTVAQGVVDLNGQPLSANGFNGATNGTILNNAGSGQALLTIGSGGGGGTWSGTIEDNLSGSGTVAVAKVGAGYQTFASSNNYSGPTTINSGASGVLFTISNPNAFGNTNGQVTEVDNNNCVMLNNNLMVTGKTINIWGTGGSPSTGNGNGSLQGNAGQTNQWAGTVRIGNGTTQGRVGVRVSGSSTGVLVLSGSIQDGLSATGAGLGLVVNCDTPGSAVVIAAPAGINTYSGQTAIGRGTLQLGATNSLPTNTVLNVGSAGNVSAVFDLNGFDQTVGGLTKSGANTGTILNSSLSSTNTLTINQSATLSYSGAIAGGTALNLAKTGSGQLTLLGDTSGWNGLTTVSNGTLLANNPSGSTGSGDVSVYGGTLGGNGYIAGSVYVYPAGTLTPGSNSLETLTISGNLTLSSGSTNTFEVDGDTTQNSQVSIGGNVTYAGELTIVTNGTFSLGQTFTLFTGGNTASTPSNFSSIAGSPGAGLAWSFANGVLSVVGSMATNPTNLTYAVSGNALSLSWPADHLGWLVQSNSVDLAVPADWQDISNTATATTYSITIDPTQTNVFYRLREP